MAAITPAQLIDGLHVSVAADDLAHLREQTSREDLT